MNLSSTIKSIQDIMRKDDGVDGDAQRIGQLTWMMFLKIFDQREEEWADDAEDKGLKYESPMPENCRWRNWAKYVGGSDGKLAPQMSSSDIIKHVNEVVFPSLKALTTEHGKDETFLAKAKVVREVFVDSNNYMKSGTLLLEVIEKLDEAINFHDLKTRKNLGDLYEQILNDLRAAGNAGEFYTPRGVTQFMVERVNPQLHESVLDPACGTGGFLTAAIQHLSKQLTDTSSSEDKKSIEKSIRAFEKKQLPHLLCTTNMLLHGIDVPSQIEHMNTLGKPWNDWGKQDKVDCLITNPPFGGTEEDGVGTDYPSDVKTRETADMFLTLIVRKLMKDGARGAIVLPDGSLFGDGVKNKIKENLLKECNLHTIIRLPNGVFNPYTGIKSNLLFFTKGQPTETIWYYEHPYPEGYKNYSKTKPIEFKEFKAEREWWGSEKNGFADRVSNKYAWKVDFKEKKMKAEAKAKPHWDKAEKLKAEASEINNQIKDLKSSIKGIKEKEKREPVEKEIEALNSKMNEVKLQEKYAKETGDGIYWPIYNLDIDNPHVEEVISHDPDELLSTYNNQQKDITELRGQLKSILTAALSNDAGSKQ